LFSDSQRAVGATLLTFSDSSSNSAAVILIVRCTEALRRTRDLLNNSNASTKTI
jgi:hypothetical protein